MTWRFFTWIIGYTNGRPNGSIPAYEGETSIWAGNTVSGGSIPNYLISMFISISDYHRAIYPYPYEQMIARLIGRFFSRYGSDSWELEEFISRRVMGRWTDWIYTRRWKRKNPSRNNERYDHNGKRAAASIGKRQYRAYRLEKQNRRMIANDPIIWCGA